jgi:hypothetical protein
MITDGRTDEEIREAMEYAIFSKPACHNFTGSGEDDAMEQHGMSQIGG